MSALSSTSNWRTYRLKNPASSSQVHVQVTVNGNKEYLKDITKDEASLMVISSFLVALNSNILGNDAKYGGAKSKAKLQDILINKLNQITVIDLQAHNHSTETTTKTKDTNTHITINVMSNGDRNLASVHLYEKDFVPGSGLEAYCIVQGPRKHNTEYFNGINNALQDDTCSHELPNGI